MNINFNRRNSKNRPKEGEEPGFQRPIVHVKMKRTKKQWQDVLKKANQTADKGITLPGYTHE